MFFLIFFLRFLSLLRIFLFKIALCAVRSLFLCDFRLRRFLFL